MIKASKVRGCKGEEGWMRRQTRSEHVSEGIDQGLYSIVKVHILDDVNENRFEEATKEIKPKRTIVGCCFFF